MAQRKNTGRTFKRTNPNEQLTEWQRKLALDIAQAFPHLPLNAAPKADPLAESEAAAITAQYDAMTAADKAREFHKNNDAEALRMQVEQGRAWGLL
jgi:hypothetical protein